MQDGNGSWEWGQNPVEALVSSDFDYDVVHLLKIVHRQVGVKERRRAGTSGRKIEILGNFDLKLEDRCSGKLWECWEQHVHVLML